MLAYKSLNICTQCRTSLTRYFYASSLALRSNAKKRPAMTPTAILREQAERKMKGKETPYYSQNYNRSPSPPVKIKAPPAELPANFRSGLHSALPDWIDNPAVKKRLISLGVFEEDIGKILRAFEAAMEKELAKKPTQPVAGDPWGVVHLWNGHISSFALMIDRAFMLRLLEFAVDSESHLNLNPKSLGAIKGARKALDLRFPGEAYPHARNMKRKFYLHVGPTNSGKTYNALRALSEAKSGAYAGPLRLLAHEVWRRFNTGDIRPFDAPLSEAHKYARRCNLLTGEEHRIVDIDAELSSCTVEMLSLFKHHHVVVIDEIQMIADPARGGAWTAAVLGVRADEIHLCGEETAVPLIEKLLAETGDELVINRYQRLTPLTVADTALEDWKSIEPGDCVVTFSRRGIFQLKTLIEEQTGLRCAVVYGRLPPETRSDQAALFNARNSGYDVLVATDAIGMGLNLKIKRVIFVALQKWNGTRDVPLTLSQVKQIGGRAGRFGEVTEGTNGVVTCMKKEEIPSLKDAFAMVPPPLPKAIMPLGHTEFSQMAQLLPHNFRLADLFTLIHLAARLGPAYGLPSNEESFKGLDVIDMIGKGLALKEKLLFCYCPVSWVNEVEVGIMQSYISSYLDGEIVDIQKCFEYSELLVSMKAISEKRLDNDESQSQAQRKQDLVTLETLHRSLLSYIWLSYRLPASFAQQEEAIKLKEETEANIEFVLVRIEHHDLLRKIAKTPKQLKEEGGAPSINYEMRIKRGPPPVRKTVAGTSASPIPTPNV